MLNKAIWRGRIILALLVLLMGYARAQDNDETVTVSPLGLVPEVYVGGVKGKFSGWNGYVDGRLYSVAAGYLFSNPAAGLLIVSDKPADGGDYYFTPKAVGPIEIIQQQDGILTLRSKLGKFERSADDTGRGAGIVEVSQTVEFYFDLKTRKFSR